MLKNLRLSNAGHWGVSIALSWLWGLGLFFSVQFSFQYGWLGLLSFAIPNAIGLFLFGAGTQHIANRLRDSKMSLEDYFRKGSGAFKSIFMFYQLIAITLTIFAVLRYFFQALDWSGSDLIFPLSIMLVIALAVFLGEEFNIGKIKHSHAVMFAVMLLSICYIILNTSLFEGSMPNTDTGVDSSTGTNEGFSGYLLPIIIGFLVGPWLDLQQWQRAIQLQKEKTSIVGGYFFGAIIFFMLLIFHGSLTMWVLQNGGSEYVEVGPDGIAYAHDIITKLFSFLPHQGLLYAYSVFIIIGIVTTLDSGYVALRWFLKIHSGKNKSMLSSLIPDKIAISPVPLFVFAGLLAWWASYLGFELIYFIVFYGSFFIGFAVVAIKNAFEGKTPDSVPQIKLLFVGLFSLCIAAFGYLYALPLLLSLGAAIPLGYSIWPRKEFVNPAMAENTQQTEISVKSPTTLTESVSAVHQDEKSTAVTAGQYLGSEYIDGKWYAYTFRATYYDTNSVGNVYFAMYAVWVGKTRELFFNYCMPDFDLNNTDFYILTRSFEHKFMVESREFETITVKLRIKSYNRKFATLEHVIFNGDGQTLGTGSQVVLFVSSKDYRPIDIPEVVLKSMIHFL